MSLSCHRKTIRIWTIWRRIIALLWWSILRIHSVWSNFMLKFWWVENIGYRALSKVAQDRDELSLGFLHFLQRRRPLSFWRWDRRRYWRYMSCILRDARQVRVIFRIFLRWIRFFICTWGCLSTKAISLCRGGCGCCWKVVRRHFQHRVSTPNIRKFISMPFLLGWGCEELWWYRWGPLLRVIPALNSSEFHSMAAIWPIHWFYSKINTNSASVLPYQRHNNVYGKDWPRCFSNHRGCSKYHALIWHFGIINALQRNLSVWGWARLISIGFFETVPRGRWWQVKSLLFW